MQASQFSRTPTLSTSSNTSICDYSCLENMDHVTCYCSVCGCPLEEVWHDELGPSIPMEEIDTNVSKALSNFPCAVTNLHPPVARERPLDRPRQLRTRKRYPGGTQRRPGRPRSPFCDLEILRRAQVQRSLCRFCTICGCRMEICQGGETALFRLHIHTWLLGSRTLSCLRKKPSPWEDSVSGSRRLHIYYIAERREERL